MSTVSVFTPSHDPRYLMECYASLQAQTLASWEWVVLLNGDAYGSHGHYRGKWADDDRVQVLRTGETDIGALKAEAVSECLTDLFVELDHDDRLTPQALACLDFASQDESASLLYSDWSHLTPTGDPLSYPLWSAESGWLHYTDPDGVLTVQAREPTPIHLSRIWWSPNHVRAFPRWAYEKAGGYRAGVLDDQDLMSRLYQVGPFLHLPYRLYEQRVQHPGSSSAGNLNQVIQEETVRMGDGYLPALVRAWQERREGRG